MLSWNCHGLGRPLTQDNLRDCIREKNPDCIFLIETKMKLSTMTRFIISLGFANFEIVPARKKGAGGLCLAWRNGVELEILSSNDMAISAMIFSDPVQHPWLLTCIYGPPYKQDQYMFWDFLNQIGSTYSGPWLCLGDFNDITSQQDKRGGNCFAQSSKGGLNSVIFNQGLIDLGFSGNSFTWSNERGGRPNIKERIDRGIANVEWRSIFHRAIVSHLPAIGSDHNPILLDTIGEVSNFSKPFKFEKMWTTSRESFDVINHAWELQVHGSIAYKLCVKLKETKKLLKIWNRDVFGNCIFKSQTTQRCH